MRTLFYNLFDSVIEFLENKNTGLCDNLITSKNDIAYLTDLNKLYNDVNLQLQGDNLNLIKTKTYYIATFVSKLLLYKKNIRRREFNSFSNLTTAHFIYDNLVVYCQHVENLHIDFKERFLDILNMNLLDWVLDSLSNTNTAESSQLEQQLLELTKNEEIKLKFKNGIKNFGCKS
ncbi:Hypothetical protein CINCED_3A015940 [Cinara cedri]|uniref:Uncharacterized protein n=1 Tax=Cinara cedri TaxID=506608 RepID=A0A5E4MGT0_9HEMI|nr:Hypothetical protein CINCED_3A015940 [Cinara cedri]